MWLIILTPQEGYLLNGIHISNIEMYHKGSLVIFVIETVITSKNFYMNRFEYISANIFVNHYNNTIKKYIS